MYVKYFKDIFDRSLALFLIVLFSPVFVIIAVSVRFESEGNPIFVQYRIGKNFNRFKLYKFRSMYERLSSDNRNGLLITKHGDCRITRLGKILRDYKLDELPQLLNVLLGDMSFVGPRPEVEKYVYLFKNHYKHILSVKPGLTDYAAIEYRDEEKVLAEYSDIENAYTSKVLPLKLELYNQYIEKMSFKTDLKIIYKTVLLIFR